MKASGFLSVLSRRVLMAAGMTAIAFAMSGVPAWAQDPAKPAEQKPADAPDPLKFDYSGPMILIYQIKPEKSADFESFWPALRAGLNKSSNADLKAFAETLQPFKVQGAPGLYIFRLDPPSKTFSYNPGKLLYDNINYQKPEEGSFTRAEADDLFKKVNESLAPNGIQTWKLEKVGAPVPGATITSLTTVR